MISEQEITKVLEILAVVLKKLGVNIGRDPEIKEMLGPLNHKGDRRSARKTTPR
jgi:hypothetical protein